jgi:peptidoglycan hydrolase CwlO-like protein
MIALRILNLFIETLKSQVSRIQAQDLQLTTVKTENKELNEKLKPLKDKIENMSENEIHLRRLLNETESFA